MAMKGKLETELELKSSADDMYHVFRKKPHHIPGHTPTNIQGVDLHHGENWETEGSIKIWKYTLEGKKEEYKEKVVFDDANKAVTLIGLDGHPMKIYKVYNPFFQFIPKQQGCLAKLAVDYEKLNPNVPVPQNYLNFMISLTKDIDARLSVA